MKGAGKLVVLLRYVNTDFGLTWVLRAEHNLSCRSPKSRLGLHVKKKKIIINNKTPSYCFDSLDRPGMKNGFFSGKKKRAITRLIFLKGFNSNFWTKIPVPFVCPIPLPGRLSHRTRGESATALITGYYWSQVSYTELLPSSTANAQLLRCNAVVSGGSSQDSVMEHFD